jgi:hypothetical protein
MGQLALQYSKDRYTYSSESGSNLLGSEQGKISFDWFDLIWFDLIDSQFDFFEIDFKNRPEVNSLLL